MRNIIIALVVLAATFAHPSANCQTIQPGYSVISTAKAQFMSDVYMSGRLNVQKVINLPRYTTTQRNALTASEGMFLYNSTLDSIQYYANGSWRTSAIGTPALWTVADFGGIDILYPSATFDRFALTKDENRFTFDGSTVTSRSDTIIFEVNSSKSYRFPSDTGSVGQVLGVSVNGGTGATTLAWVTGITLQDSIISQKDTAGLAAELVAIPETLSIIQNLIARVMQLENRLQLVGILPEEE